MPYTLHTGTSQRNSHFFSLFSTWISKDASPTSIIIIAIVLQIELPHGAKVIINPSSVVIYPSLGDVEAIGGLCGQFDLVCGNDFLGGDGRQFSDPCNPNPDCSNIASCQHTYRPDDFSETWRYHFTSNTYFVFNPFIAMIDARNTVLQNLKI